ncbi:hypothetical protein F5B22DRAFT_655851 [Xylaria bambusicola]|uniref:uncharacterized protein n=1 Tax=Xylaria bambusicola TaxID=326684 RepID=UPI0020079D65|nr:uncharacterized protein F5B22DRAFT_655851 [Xylaria bambusicola]KAI0526729.1 hypothetical protein F5B22DRAFT_655851 [Xylaria bambusicola]
MGSGTARSPSSRNPIITYEGMKGKALGKPEQDTYDKLVEEVKQNNQGDNGLECLVDRLLERIVTILKTQTDNQSIEFFLKQLETQETIDDCVLWLLLVKCVNIQRGKSSEREVRISLSKIILGLKPYLAFITLNGEADDVMRTAAAYKKCIDSKRHSEYETPDIPFNLAAQEDNYKVVAFMISTGEKFYKHQSDEDKPGNCTSGGRNSRAWAWPKILQRRNPYYRALELAARPSKGSLETLEKLLEVEGIALIDNDPGNPDPTFEYAIREGRLGVVEMFLKKRKLAEIFATGKNINLAFEKLKGSSEKFRSDRLMIAQKLLEKVEKQDVITRMIMKEIITAGAKEVWEAIKEPMLKNDLKACLLHMAVNYQNREFVKTFLNKYPDSVNQKQAIEDGGTLEYPLWYNNHLPGSDGSKAGDTTKGEIRALLVNKMIREVSEIERLTQIFFDSDEPVADLCFDPCGINSASYRVSEFIDSLIWQSRNQKLLSYEQTLRYAEFPPLDMMANERESFTESSHLKQEHDEVFKILEWLSGKGVKTIIKLKVPDRLVNPHDDIRMGREVNRFEVEILDWRVLDLSISSLEEETKTRLKELHLYSSGNRAAISHWFGSEGIRLLTNLDTVEIKIVQETCTLKRFSALKTEIREKFKQLPNTQNHLIPRIELVRWYPTQELADLSEIARRVAPKLAQRLQKLGNIVGRKRDEKDSKFRPTKVAILDNGILSISPISHQYTEEGDSGRQGEKVTIEGGRSDHGDAAGAQTDAQNTRDQHDDDRSLWKRIKEGRSFVDGDSRLSPWLFASNPHGTQMANLICAIDPFCELYVARVAEDARGITANRVAQALTWARKKEVDVISMSFTITADPDKAVSTQIEEASKAGIIMTCSAHDEGSRTSTAIPAKYSAEDRSLIRLAASDEYGKILRETDKNNYDYLIPGQDVAAGVIPFLKSEDTITGSSVSTAIAAGLSSLILTCDRAKDPCMGYRDGTQDGSRYRQVKKYLNTMTTEANPQFLHLDNFDKTGLLA